MKQLAFTKKHNLSKLHDELIAQVPGFHRTTPNSEGNAQADPDCGRVEGSGHKIWIYFADDLDPDTITNVVKAHRPN